MWAESAHSALPRSARGGLPGQKGPSFSRSRSLCSGRRSHAVFPVLLRIQNNCCEVKIHQPFEKILLAYAGRCLHLYRPPDFAGVLFLPEGSGRTCISSVADDAAASRNHVDRAGCQRDLPYHSCLCRTGYSPAERDQHPGRYRHYLSGLSDFLSVPGSDWNEFLPDAPSVLSP